MTQETFAHPIHLVPQIVPFIMDASVPVNSASFDAVDALESVRLPPSFAVLSACAERLLKEDGLFEEAGSSAFFRGRFQLSLEVFEEGDSSR